MKDHIHFKASILRIRCLSVSKSHAQVHSDRTSSETPLGDQLLYTPIRSQCFWIGRTGLIPRHRHHHGRVIFYLVVWDLRLSIRPIPC